jgi:hypothetical protein
MTDFPSLTYHVKPLLGDFINNVTSYDDWVTALKTKDFGSLIFSLKEAYVYSDPLISAIILCLAFAVWVWTLSTITRNFSQVFMRKRWFGMQMYLILERCKFYTIIFD